MRWNDASGNSNNKSSVGGGFRIKTMRYQNGEMIQFLYNSAGVLLGAVDGSTGEIVVLTPIGQCAVA